YLCAYNLNLALALLPLLLLGSLSWLVFCGNASWQAPVPRTFGALALWRGPLPWLGLAGMVGYSISPLAQPVGYFVVPRVGLTDWVHDLPTLATTLLLTLALILPVIVAAFIFVEFRFRRVAARPSHSLERLMGAG